MSRNDRLDKVLAVAINPGAYEPEAVAALRKARQLVKRDPALAFNLPGRGGPCEAASDRARDRAAPARSSHAGCQGTSKSPPAAAPGARPAASARHPQS